MKDIVIKNLIDWHQSYKEKRLRGRWITYKMIQPILEELSAPFFVEQVGESFFKTPIHTISVGVGDIKILLWSQMHGNESTGTKAIFDLLSLFKYLGNKSAAVDEILQKCTLVFIPILNPDGAERYTRVNGQGIDLNRDAVALKAKESIVLRDVLTELRPSFCFNLHDQRTIFSVGAQKYPASISFLAPSVDKERTITKGRKMTMSVIVAMHKMLQNVIPNQIGRYTDEFYPTATGDNFQKEGYCTILIEAGHFTGDYAREKVRMYNFLAILEGLHCISNGIFNIYKPYYNIPNNAKLYLDRIYRNVFFVDENLKTDIGILFIEELIDGSVFFKPTIECVAEYIDCNADVIIDMEGERYKNRRSFECFIEKKILIL